MTLYELEDKLEQLRALNRLDPNLKVILHYPELEEDSYGDTWSHKTPASSVTLKGRDLIISCC